MWLPVDLVLAALLSSAFELAWVAERGGLSADGDPSDLDTDSLYVPALAPSPAPAFSPGGELWRELAASAHRSPDSRAGRPGGRRGRRSNRCTDWRLVTATSGHTAPTAGPAPATAQGDPVPGPNQARLMRMLPSGHSPGSLRTCHDTATCPRQNCLHAQRRPRRAHGGNLHPCRRKSVATAAFRRSPARLNHRHVPGKHSVARTLAPQRHAPASQRHAGLQLSRRPRGGHLDHRANLLVSDVHADRAGPALNQLYQWWSAHS